MGGRARNYTRDPLSGALCYLTKAGETSLHRRSATPAIIFSAFFCHRQLVVGRLIEGVIRRRVGWRDKNTLKIFSIMQSAKEEMMRGR